MRRFHDEARNDTSSDDENELDEANLYDRDRFGTNQPRRTSRWSVWNLPFYFSWSRHTDTRGTTRGFGWLSYLVTSIVNRFIPETPQGNVPNPANVGIMYDNRSPPYDRDVPNIPVYFDNSSTPVTLSLNELRAAKHPEYVRYERRLRSFDMWPAGRLPTKERLAGAGFFYTGESDQTSCYYCGLGLVYWLPNDDPIQEHARWSPRCKHNFEALRLELIRRS